MLDYNSLLVALGFSGACLFLMLLVNWLAARAESTMLGWAISVALIVCNVLAYGQYVKVPSRPLGLFVVTTLLVALAMLLATAREFRLHRSNLRLWALVSVLACLSVAPFMAVGPVGLAFMIYNVAAAILLLSIAREYWLARREAPLPITCLAVLYAMIGMSFLQCAVVLSTRGEWYLAVAPHNWAETLNIIVSIAGMSGIGALSLELNQSKLARSHMRASLTDGLTELPNRRALFDKFPNVRPFTVLVLFDLDHFKAINDEHGHAVGDEVLRRFAAILSEEIRQTDFPARLGGEEFLIVLPRSTHERGAKVAERIRKRFAGEILHTGQRDLRCTVSAGVAFADEGEEPTLDALLLLADKALYEAKNAGRNQVSMPQYRLAG